MKRIWLALFMSCLAGLSGCTSTENDETSTDMSMPKAGVSGVMINQVVRQLADQLSENAVFIRSDSPLAITSFSELDDLQQASWLGNQISEAMIHEMHVRGYQVLEFKNTGRIRVTEDGDFVLSRNWKELQKQYLLDYVLTGTLVPQPEGVQVNARVIGMRSHVVVATAQGFIPQSALGKDHDQWGQLRMKDGMIIRTESEISQHSSAVQLVE